LSKEQKKLMKRLSYISKQLENMQTARGAKSQGHVEDYNSWQLMLKEKFEILQKLGKL